MKIETVFNHYKKIEEILRCPICKEIINIVHPASATCINGHCFDCASFNYVNFIPNQKPTNYTKELFESRRIVLENNYYQPLLNELLRIIESYKKDEFTLLDVGCGEGYYSRAIHAQFDATIIGFDNAKEAIKLAGKSDNSIYWFMADLTNIPLKPKSIDFICDVLTPSNYQEFERLLSDDGICMKVIPGEQYLKELKKMVGLSTDGYTIDAVTDYFKTKMDLIDVKNIKYTKEVNDDDKIHFAKMTPLMLNRDITELEVKELKECSFDFMILVGRIKEK
jgi:23S rRNA (guanine745-N1)-methyltransferase